MPLVQDRSRSQLAFQMAGGDVDRFQVMRYRGSEGLCQLYRFEIELATDDLAVAFDDIVGKSAVLSINTVTHERWFHGIISRFELTNQTVSAIAGSWLGYSREGLPLDRLFEVARHYESLTGPEIQAAFRKYLDIDRLSTFILGPPVGMR